MKLLYITANPKPEEQSACLTVGRRLVDKCRQHTPGVMVEEMHLYNEDIPEVDFTIYRGRAALKGSAEYNCLGEDKKAKADRINYLCGQFISADRYVLAAPMWSLMFPGRMKDYIDCIVQDGSTIALKEKSVEGLLDDKDRRMVYVQSSGGKYSNIVTSRFDYGTDYLCMLFKYLGIRKFFNIPVEGTGLNNTGIAGALMKATDEVDEIVPMFMS